MMRCEFCWNFPRNFGISLSCRGSAFDEAIRSLVITTDFGTWSKEMNKSQLLWPSAPRFNESCFVWFNGSLSQDCFRCSLATSAASHPRLLSLQLPARLKARVAQKFCPSFSILFLEFLVLPVFLLCWEEFGMNLWIYSGALSVVNIGPTIDLKLAQWSGKLNGWASFGFS